MQYNEMPTPGLEPGHREAQDPKPVAYGGDDTTERTDAVGTWHGDARGSTTVRATDFEYSEADVARTYRQRSQRGDRQLPWSVDEIRAVFDYDPDTGVIRWKVPRYRKIKAGQVAGALRPDGYLFIGYKYENVLAHRIAWAHYHGRDSLMVMDHINGDRADNRIANLREVTFRGNRLNTVQTRARERAA